MLNLIYYGTGINIDEIRVTKGITRQILMGVLHHYRGKDFPAVGCQ
ncbi:hypothetical protein J7K55_01800 [Candidatus Aerophobetes bacterium]|nr:hypothetical protein [Candidatus Aerophobetes bacterium]